VPTWAYGTNHDYILDLARALLQRGASVHDRDEEGDTPLRNWCYRTDITSAKGILMLLDAGANLDTSAIYYLCSHNLLQVLHELSMADRLQVMDLKKPTRQYKRDSSSALDTRTRKEMILQLLWTEQRHWHKHVRPAVLALLGSHDSLVPDLAELVVSFIDGKCKSKA
jgi:hypothetical protein